MHFKWALKALNRKPLYINFAIQFRRKVLTPDVSVKAEELICKESSEKQAETWESDILS